ncbi:MAG: hypothetical protein JXA95_14995, partial [Spirochaetales bacterium]|nr:hypothetical protein [Spirochaetales bacterium]
MTGTPLNRWRFTKEGRSEEITLPHCWNRAEEGAAYYRGACLYECGISLNPQPDRVYYAEFEGAASLARLSVNGRPAGEHRGGFSTFRFDITPLLRSGNNTLSLTVDNSHREDIYPLMADFAFMGGLYRPARLIEAGSSRISLDDRGSEGVYVRQKKLTRKRVDFEVEVLLTRPAEGPDLTCRCVLISPEGKRVIRKKQKVKEDRVLFEMTLENPRLWEGRGDPALYGVEVVLKEGKEEIDRRH